MLLFDPKFLSLDPNINLNLKIYTLILMPIPKN